MSGNEAERRERAAPGVADLRGWSVEKVRWNVGMRDAFFDHLAGSGDVAASAALVGLSVSQVDRRRRTDPAFAERWERAIEAGYQLIETRLIGYVLAGGGDMAPSFWERAIKLLAMYKARGERRGTPAGTAPQVATRDDTDRTILRQLASLTAGRARLARPAPGVAGKARQA